MQGWSVQQSCWLQAERDWWVQEVTSVEEDEVTWVFVGRKEADLKSWEQTDKLFARVKPTHVLHLAARVGGLFANQRDNLGFFQGQHADARQCESMLREA